MNFLGFSPGHGQDGGNLPPGRGQPSFPMGAGGAVPVQGYPGTYSPFRFAGQNAASFTGNYSSMYSGYHANPYAAAASPFYPVVAAPGGFVGNPYTPYGAPTTYTPGVTPGLNQLPVWANNQPNGQGGFLRHPHVPPNIDPSLPAAQLTNSTGGTGCEPGYNYFFPARHCKIHVFKCEVPPWQAGPDTPMTFNAVHVPIDTTVAELMRGFGCSNPDPKQNCVYEIHTTGQNKWYKGICFSGDMKDEISKPIKDVGWDDDRTGQPPRYRPVVCLYFTK